MSHKENVRAVIREAKTYLGVPYVLGGLSREGIDCRGLIRKASGNVGLRLCYGGALGNVREFVRSARERGFYHEVTSGYVPKRGDAIVWFNTQGGGAGPEHLQHIGFVLQPKNNKWPNGFAISAKMPKVATHTFNLQTLAIHGYIEPDWSAAVVAIPADEPEPAY